MEFKKYVIVTEYLVWYNKVTEGATEYILRGYYVKNRRKYQKIQKRKGAFSGDTCGKA